MSFETAKFYSDLVHYIIVIIPAIVFCAWRVKSIIGFVSRFYLCILVWSIVCFLCDGCPLTHLENRLSLMIYGRAFYANYDYHDTDSFFLLQIWQFYVPAVVVLVIKMINKITQF